MTESTSPQQEQVKTGPYILFITGVSTSGKTTIYESLKSDEELADFEFHDIDESGVPPVGRTPWRAFRVEELFYQATQKLREGKSSIICGITKPHEVIESKHYKPELNIHFLLVDITSDTAVERISRLIEDQSRTENNDEVFDKDSSDEIIVATKSLARILIHSTQNQKNGYILDAGQLRREEMISSAKDIINLINQPR
jgi:hypothetical protein